MRDNQVTKRIEIDAKGAKVSHRLMADAFEQEFAVNRRVSTLIVTTPEIHREMVRLCPDRLLYSVGFRDGNKIIDRTVKPGSALEFNGVVTLASERIPPGEIRMGYVWNESIIDNPPVDLDVVIHNVSVA